MTATSPPLTMLDPHASAEGALEPPSAFAAIALAAVSWDGVLSMAGSRALRHALDYRHPYCDYGDAGMVRLMDQLLRDMRRKGAQHLMVEAAEVLNPRQRATAYAVAETLGWRESLELKARQAKAFYGVIVVSMLVALLLNLSGIEPINFLILAATLNGLAAPVLMAIIWFLAKDKNLLGKWASGRISKLLLGLATLAMGSLPLFWLISG